MDSCDTILGIVKIVSNGSKMRVDPTCKILLETWFNKSKKITRMFAKFMDGSQKLD